MRKGLLADRAMPIPCHRCMSWNIGDQRYMLTGMEPGTRQGLPRHQGEQRYRGVSADPLEEHAPQNYVIAHGDRSGCYQDPVRHRPSQPPPTIHFPNNFTIPIHRMSRLTIALLLITCFRPGAAHAQADGQGPRLIDDLCVCMSAIDLKHDDRAVEGGVRDCLENAVVLHPSEVRALLHRQQGTSSKAFQLGSVLGGALERDCQGFRAVRARLQQMPPSALLKKQGT